MNMRFTLSTRDFLKGLVVAVGTSVLVVVQQTVEEGELTFNWKTIGIAAIGATVSYLLKNLLTDDVKAAQTTLQTAAKKELKKQIKKESKVQL